MNTRYCSKAGCGHANQYTAIKPKFCGACGQPFDAAFAFVAPAAPVEQPIRAPAARPQHPATRQPRTFQSARDQRRAPIAETQYEESGDNDHFDDSPADRDAAFAEAQEIAAGLDPNSFGIGTSEKPQVFRFGDIPNLRDAATKMASGDGGDAKKRAPRTKKAKA